MSYKTFCKQACASFGSSRQKVPVQRSRSAVKDLGSRHKWWSDGFARRRHGCSMFGDATGFTGFGLDEIWVSRIWGCRRRQLTSSSPSPFVSWWKGWITVPFSFQGMEERKVSSPFARAPSLSRRRVSVCHRRRGRGEPCSGEMIYVEVDDMRSSNPTSGSGDVMSNCHNTCINYANYIFI